MPAKKLKTSSVVQPNVAEKATNVAKKATPKKPTLKQLQDQYDAAVVTIDSLNAMLDLKNILITNLEQDVANLKSDKLALEREVNILNASVRCRDELIDRLETPWWKRALNLFGN